MISTLIVADIFNTIEGQGVSEHVFVHGVQSRPLFAVPNVIASHQGSL